MPKVICQHCKGNGFIRKDDHPDIRKQSIEQCTKCKSQGELETNTTAFYHQSGKDIDEINN